MAEMVDCSNLLSCRDCDTLHRGIMLPAGQAASCFRCGATLYRCHTAGLDRPLAYVVTGLICYVVANCFPLLFLELGGRTQESTLWMGVTALQDAGLWFLAFLVFCTMLLFPLLNLLSMLYLLVPWRWQRPPWRQSVLFLRMLQRLSPWCMTGVYALGVMVAVVKLRDLANVKLGVALFAFAALLLMSIFAASTLDYRTLWQRMDAKK